MASQVYLTISQRKTNTYPSQTIPKIQEKNPNEAYYKTR